MRTLLLSLTLVLAAVTASAQQSGGRTVNKFVGKFYGDATGLTNITATATNAVAKTNGTAVNLTASGTFTGNGAGLTNVPAGLPNNLVTNALGFATNLTHYGGQGTLAVTETNTTTSGYLSAYTTPCLEWDFLTGTNPVIMNFGDTGASRGQVFINTGHSANSSNPQGTEWQLSMPGNIAIASGFGYSLNGHIQIGIGNANTQPTNYGQWEYHQANSFIAGGNLGYSGAMTYRTQWKSNGVTYEAYPGLLGHGVDTNGQWALHLVGSLGVEGANHNGFTDSWGYHTITPGLQLQWGLSNALIWPGDAIATRFSATQFVAGAKSLVLWNNGSGIMQLMQACYNTNSFAMSNPNDGFGSFVALTPGVGAGNGSAYFGFDRGCDLKVLNGTSANTAGATYFRSGTAVGGSFFNLGGLAVGKASAAGTYTLEVAGTAQASNLVVSANSAGPPTVTGNDGAFWNSNKVVFWVTTTKTNVVSDGR